MATNTTPIYHHTVLVLCLGLHKAEVEVLPKLGFDPGSGMSDFQVHFRFLARFSSLELRSLFFAGSGGTIFSS